MKMRMRVQRHNMKMTVSVQGHNMTMRVDGGREATTQLVLEVTVLLLASAVDRDNDTA